MNRKCFLCCTNLELIFSSFWPLPGIETSEIGFSVCPGCGSVAQSPSVPFEKMMKYYETIAVYNNPGREGMPTETKVRDVEEQIQFIKRGMGYFPSSVLQIGSSDGYTLSRFQNEGASVLGVEPGAASVKIAQERYNVKCVESDAESFETNEKFELILLTHVLEHLYEPQLILEKCRQLQNQDESFIYVEVPLLSGVNSLCPGFFSFEHINYYTKENLISSLYGAGYYPISSVEHFKSNLSPIIGVLASTKEQKHYGKLANEYNINKSLVETYREKELYYWQGCLNRIEEKLLGDGKIYLWGAGIHTSQLVSNTNLLDNYSVAGLVDTSSLKWGMKQGDWICCDPKKIDWQAGDKVIISSYASEKEIYDALDWLRNKDVLTLRLHNIDDSKSH